jgi:hypothetical protein
VLQIATRFFYVVMGGELTEYELRREHRLDKFIDHLDPVIRRELEPEQVTYLELMRKAFHWQTKFFSPEDVRKMLMQPTENGGKGYSYQMACQIFVDAEYLFGKLKDLDKKALRKKLTEQLMKANQMAIMDSNASGIEKSEIIGKNAERIAKLHGLYNDADDISPEVLMPRRTVVINVDNRKVILNGSIDEQGGMGATEELQAE